MTINAFSALGISGNKVSAHKPWYLDSADSNHMTSTTAPLNNVQKYKGHFISKPLSNSTQT